MSGAQTSENASRADSSHTLAQHIERTVFSDLPQAVVNAAKTSILDTIGCIVAGSSTDDVRAMTSMVKRWGGAPLCTVLGAGGLRLPPQSAALLNGAATHQQDFDDVHDSFTCHPTASTLSAALAAAEEKGDVSGKDLILAIALGNDITCRVSRAILSAHGHPWYRAPVVGMFGATAASAKIFAATKEQIVEAFGLALPQIGGTYASLYHSGSSVRSIRDGLMYRDGLLAAELAVQGIKGDPEVFDGKFGFYQVYYKGAYNRDYLLEDLGKDYETARVSLKPWPSARHLHTTITAVLDLCEQHQLNFDDIANVVFDVGKVNLARCDPLTAELQHNHIDLLGNLPYAVAAAIKNRDVSISAYLDGVEIDNIVNLAMPKVQWRMNPDQDGPWRFEPGRVEIRTKTGATLKAECFVARGHPDNPMTQKQLHDKFRTCVAMAATPMNDSQASLLIDMLSNLEKLPALSELTRLL